MSRTSQDTDSDHLANDDNCLHPIHTSAYDRTEDFSKPTHHHPRAELIYAAEGVMRVSTKHATWVVPPQQAVWIPPGIEHSMSHTGPIVLRILYLHPQTAQQLPSRCCVISISPLLREIILHASTFSHHYQPESPEARIMSVIPDLLSTAKKEPLQLPLPLDRRLRAITDALMQQPANKQAMTYWADYAGTSERTLSRRFRQETGMSFNEWRQRLRLLSAITQLSAGASVTAVAYDLGYESPSAFIAMFRRKLGESPLRYLQQRTQ